MARSFNGSSDYVEVLSSPIAGGSFTIAYWFILDTGAAGHKRAVVLSDRSSATERISLGNEETAGDGPRFNCNDGTTNSVADFGALVSKDVWHHCIGVENGGTTREIYIDGTFGEQSSTGLTYTGNIDTVTIGAWQNSGGREAFWLGDVAEVAIWNIAFTGTKLAEDRSALAAGVSPLLVRPDALVFYAPLIGFASPETERMQSRNLTVSGAAAAAHCPIIYPSEMPEAAFAAAAAVGPTVAPYPFPLRVL